MLLQHYWWFIISLLGALLVFLLFVQGGQALLYRVGRTEAERDLAVNVLGRKWEFTFTTLVTFGGAFFASFPLFYSTSFGGAFYVWMAILLVFVIQAVAYQYRRKPANLFGHKTYEWFLLINGLAGPLLLGTAVGTLFFGAPFTVDRTNLLHGGCDPVISQWATPWHGLDALADPRNLLLGLSVSFLACMLGLHFLLNAIDDEPIRTRSAALSRNFGGLFLLFFLSFAGFWLTATGYTFDPATGAVAAEQGKYLHNLLAMPYVAVLLLAGAASIVWGWWIGWRRASRRAIWFSGAGTVGAVLGLLLCAGWNHTCYYPSTVDPASSLTISNSSSSEFTLRTMSVVSLLIPFVAAYIWYAWRALTRPVSRQEIADAEHRY